jgi:hypothetical protein
VALLIMVRPVTRLYLWATHADRIRTDGHSRRLPLNTDRPVQHAIITAHGEPPATASPRYPDDGGTRPWPYELRFYDPPADGFVANCDFPVPNFLGSTSATTPWGLVPGFKPRLADLARSPAHNSDIDVVRRSLKP